MMTVVGADVVAGQNSGLRAEEEVGWSGMRSAESP